MASGLLIKQKQLIAGDGITIEHAQTSSTISLSNSTLNAAVRIYDATIDSDTGVVTITDGTPVADLNIGDEIRTPDGVYQKVKDGITTTGPADGTRIKVSGITSPSDANGYYALQSEDVWKHETANYWITLFFSEGWTWMLSNKSDPSDPGESLFWRSFGTGGLKPWEMDGSWQPWNGAEGSPQFENVEASTTITNTIDLFEYASVSVASADIVQSVNGNKPDASGNVTIDTSSGGLTSVSVGNGLTGNGTSSSPIKLDLSNYNTTEQIYLASSQSELASVKIISSYTNHGGGSGGAAEQASNWDNVVILDADGVRINSSVGITLNVPFLNKLKLKQGTHSGAANDAYGLAVVGSNGKLPDTILPSYVKTVNNVAPDGTGNVSIELPDGGLTSVSVGNGLTGNGTSSSPIKLDLSTAVMEHDWTINAQGHRFTVNNLDTVSIQTISMDLTLSSEFSLYFPNYSTGVTINESGIDIRTTAMLLNACIQNTAGGFAIVGEDGKLPSSILPASTVDLSNYTGALNITATSNASIRGGTSGNYDITIGDSSHGVTVYAAQNNPTVSITSFGSGGNIDLNSANINVGGSSGSTKITLKSSNVSVEPTTGGGTFSVDVTSSGNVKFTAGNIYFNDNASNTAGGFAIVDSDGKLPSSIIPVSSNRHPFTSSDLSSNVLTITTTGNVTGVIDDSGKAWNFADEEVTYTDSTVSVDLSGVFARKGIATPTGTWKLMLYGA